MSISSRLTSSSVSPRDACRHSVKPTTALIPRLAKKAVLPIREPVITNAMTMMARYSRSRALGPSRVRAQSRSRWRQLRGPRGSSSSEISRPIPSDRPMMRRPARWLRLP